MGLEAQGDRTHRSLYVLYIRSLKLDRFSFIFICFIHFKHIHIHMYKCHQDKFYYSKTQLFLLIASRIPVIFFCFLCFSRRVTFSSFFSVLVHASLVFVFLFYFYFFAFSLICNVCLICSVSLVFVQIVSCVEGLVGVS